LLSKKAKGKRQKKEYFSLSFTFLLLPLLN